MTCSIFWMVIIIFSDEDLFAIFITETLFVRCNFLSSFAFCLIIFNSLIATNRFLFSSEGCDQQVSVGVFIGEVFDLVEMRYFCFVLG